MVTQPANRTGKTQPRKRRLRDQCPACTATRNPEIVPKQPRKSPRRTSPRLVVNTMDSKVTTADSPPSDTSAVYDTWLQCNVCRTWYHTHCLGISVTECRSIKRYHCPECAVKVGPSIYFKQNLRRSRRTHTMINYADLNEGTAGDLYKYTKVLRNRQFPPAPFTTYATGEFLTRAWMDTYGLQEPLLIESPKGLEMKMPPRTTTVTDIARLVGESHAVDVIDVANQGELTGWDLGQWAQYFNQTHRDRLLNVISLEFSDTPLMDQVQRPRIVQQLDWTNLVWPEELCTQPEFPRVQHYCLMSVRDSYTDFHVDFGGTSVFYHLLSGEKRFYFIPPMLANLRKYEKWMQSADQANVFFADQVKTCYQVTLQPGNTMFIPSGWIHAVYTPKDSIVIGGNFLSDIDIDMQLRMYYLEERVKVPQAQRFPLFERTHWLAAEYYLDRLKGQTTLPPLTLRQIRGLLALGDFLWDQLARISEKDLTITPLQRRHAKLAIPKHIKHPQQLVDELRKLAKVAFAGTIK
ncbi:JmjC domain-containing histone demethylation protein 1 [Dispira simplex]|nr:JmjC domain-containing histone demethylation protein 1 [Dispira simplex]